MDVESAVTDAAVDLEMSNFEAIDDIEQRTLALRLKTKDAFKGLRNSLMEKITPGRYLLLTDSSFHQRADAEDEKSDEAEEAPEDDEFQGDFVTPFRAEHGFDLAPHERFVFVDGEQISIWEYLGNEWSALIEERDHIGAIEDGELPSLLLDLKHYQYTGVAKLLHLLQGPCSGGICGDEMGLGKTIMSLIVCLLARKRGITRGSFDLVVTTKTCVQQWKDEMFFQFGEENTPKVYDLSASPKVTANELLDGNYDFVVCTYQWLQHHHRKWQEHVEFYELVEKHGMEGAKAHLRKDNRAIPTRADRRITSCLYSSIYRELNLPIRTLILDEAQFVKNHDGATHQAVKELWYSKVLMLSGTFVPNRWDEVFGLLDLLKGHPFVTKEDFARTFGSGQQTPSQQNRLIKFLQAIVVARPSSLLELEDCETKIIGFALDDEDKALIANWTKKFRQALQLVEADDPTDIQKDSQKSLAMGFAVRAQQAAASFLLLPTDDDMRERIKRDRMAGATLLQKFNTWYSTAHEDLNAANKKVKAEALNGWIRETAMKEAKEKRRQKRELQDRDYDPMDEDDDDGKVDDAGMDVDEYGSNTKYKPSTPEPLPKKIQTREEWLVSLKDATTHALWSGKVLAILDTVFRIWTEWPGEKIVIFSRLLSFLDIIDEALQRSEQFQGRAGEVLRFDGTMDAEKRSLVRDRFRRADVNGVLLITAGSGGAGMNLTAASHVILCEPWWNVNDERQAIARCLRSGQKKRVHCWILEECESSIDVLIRDCSVSKAVVNDAIVAQLRRTDDEEATIPKQFKQ